MNDKKCQKCGMEGLGWNPEDHEAIGKWRLWDHENNVAHEEKCPKRTTNIGGYEQKFQSLARFTKSLYEKCSFCDGYFVKKEGNSLHKEAYHKDKVVHCGSYVIGHASGLHWEEEIWPSKYSK